MTNRCFWDRNLNNQKHPKSSRIFEAASCPPGCVCAQTRFLLFIPYYWVGNRHSDPSPNASMDHICCQKAVSQIEICSQSIGAAISFGITISSDACLHWKRSARTAWDSFGIVGPSMPFFSCQEWFGNDPEICGFVLFYYKPDQIATGTAFRSI